MPSKNNLTKSSFFNDFISFAFALINKKGNNTIVASKYLNPAKVRGGKSFNPFFIITKEVDHKKVTRSPRSIALVLRLFKQNLMKVLKAKIDLAINLYRYLVIDITLKPKKSN